MEIEIRARLTNGRPRFKAGRPVKANQVPPTCRSQDARATRTKRL